MLRLKENEVKQKVKEELQNGLKEIISAPEEPLQKWNKITEIFRDTSQRHLKRSSMKKKQWMTDEILTLMEQRRTLKNRNREEYHSVHIKIKKKIKNAKEE